MGLPCARKVGRLRSERDQRDVEGGGRVRQAAVVGGEHGALSEATQAFDRRQVESIRRSDGRWEGLLGYWGTRVAGWLGGWVAGNMGDMKVTLDIGDEALYRAVKVEAARSDRTVRAIVAEALEQWLERLEDQEDRAAAEVAIAEYERDGGAVDAAGLFATRAAETRERYGSGRA